MRRRNTLMPVTIIVLQLLLLGLPAFSPAPVAAEVSPVPPGLILPVGPTIRTWESGATDFSTPNSVNRILWEKYSAGYYASFPPNQGIPETMPSRPLYFVRVYTGNDPRGPWVMRAAEVRGLTPQQIQNRFALPAVPTNIAMVVVPANLVPLWTGIAGPIAQFNGASGGGQQSFIMSNLRKFPDYSAIENYNWPFIPSDNYLHGQPVMGQALLYKPTVGGGNAGSVAAYLDQFIPQPYSDLENVYTLLDYLNYVGYGPGLLRSAMQQISPERYGALPMLGLRADLLFGNALMQRSQALRLGLSGGQAASGAAWPEDLGRLAHLASVSNFSLPRLISPAESSFPGSREFGVWARGVGEFGTQDSFDGRTGFNYSTGGVVGGIDWRPRQDLVLGFGAAYLGTGFNWDQSGGNGTISYAKFGLYGSYFTPRWFVDGVFSGGVNWTDTTRNIMIVSDSPLMSLVNRSANGSQTGHDLSLQGRAGVNFFPWDWCLTPMAGLAYFNLHQDAFTENGASGLNLNVQANEAQTLRTTLGARLARNFATGQGQKFTAEAQLGWAHNFALDNRVINASLVELGGAFATRGFNGDTDSLLVGAGLTAQLRNGLSLSAHYGAEIGWSFNFHTVNLGLRYEF